MDNEKRIEDLENELYYRKQLKLAMDELDKPNPFTNPVLNREEERSRIKLVNKLKTVVAKFDNVEPELLPSKVEVYRPQNLEIIDYKDGGFAIVDSEHIENQLSIVLEFNPTNSDLPTEMTREFTEYLVGYYNYHYDKE
jgi:hypothetical protein